MTRMLLRSGYATTALLSLSLLAGIALAQENCPNCPVRHGHAGSYYGDTGAGHFGRYNNLGDCTYRHYGQHDLFYNYYAGNNCGGMGAALYVSPRPVPAYVGHTYVTYQPFMPHEYLYPHHRTYHRYYNGGAALTRTSAHYRTTPVLNWMTHFD